LSSPKATATAITRKKLPFTPTALCAIASNTKLFTAVSAGMLVEEGKLTCDKPILQSVPAIQFYNDELNNTVTLHDVLSHRTGITRHRTIWYKSEFTRKELFNRLKCLEPQLPIRQMFLYNPANRSWDRLPPAMSYTKPRELLCID
jgi:CubicO group peptidase (beta-lactamase class C family)